MTKIKLAVAGCAGRMGKLLTAAIQNHDETVLAGGLVRCGSPYQDHDIGTLNGGSAIGIDTITDAPSLFAAADCIIDFSHVSAIQNHVQAAVSARKPIVIAVTGLGEDDHQAINQAAQTIPILQAANTSLGINVLMKLVQQAARYLDDKYDVDITEVHHRHKKDAPSGTSLALARSVHQGRPTPMTDYFYNLPSTALRPQASIGFSVTRSGGYPGDHSVTFASDDEVVTLTHHAFNRQIYAQGAIKAAVWLCRQPAGLYHMGDVLALG